MNAWRRIVLIGVTAILIYDIAASFAAASLGFPYYQALYGSWLIYAGIGYVAGRATNSIRRAASATAIVGGAEATIGWWLSWMIGPGRPASGTPSFGAILQAVWLVVLVAACIGLVAGLIARRRPARSILG